MFKPSRIRKQIFLAFIDLMLLVLALPLTLYLRNFRIPSSIFVKVHFIYFLPIMGFWMLSMYTAGFYILEKPLSLLNNSVKLLLIATITAGFGFSVFYLFVPKNFTPKTVLFLYVFTSYILILAWRNIYRLVYFSLKNYPKVLFIGYNDVVAELLNFLEKDSYFKYQPTAVFSSRKEVKTPVLTLHTANELRKVFDEAKIDVVVLSATHYEDNEVRQILFSLLSKNVVIYIIQDFYELVTRQLPIDVLSDSWIISRIDLNSKKLYFLIKRVADIFISLLGLLIFLPFFPIVAFLVKITSKGPVFFKQQREGRNGKIYTILKFRSMTVDNNDFSLTQEKDPRVTTVGKFMRKTRIDEIPQLLNVLNGDMSIIGPRPERPEVSEELVKKVPFYQQRLLVKPGITGWDQVSGEYHSPTIDDTIKKVKNDLYYIKNISARLDLSILFKTIITVIKKAGR